MYFTVVTQLGQMSSSLGLLLIIAFKEQLTALAVVILGLSMVYLLSLVVCIFQTPTIEPDDEPVGPAPFEINPLDVEPESASFLLT
jgi:uncharacterized membrane protein YqjE